MPLTSIHPRATVRLLTTGLLALAVALALGLAVVAPYAHAATPAVQAASCADARTAMAAGQDVTLTTDVGTDSPCLALVVTGSVTLDLNGHALVAKGTDGAVGGEAGHAGIQVVAGNTLIVTDSAGSGTLSATAGATSKSAGIGGSYQVASSRNPGDNGTITIKGGTITATGVSGGAGIGGASAAWGGYVTIAGGTVVANGANGGAGIGGGQSRDGGYITISGGTVTATGGTLGGAGIGGGSDAIQSSTTITGGTIVAQSSGNGAGVAIGLSNPAATGTAIAAQRLLGDTASLDALHTFNTTTYVGSAPGATETSNLLTDAYYTASYTGRTLTLALYPLSVRTCGQLAFRLAHGLDARLADDLGTSAAPCTGLSVAGSSTFTAGDYTLIAQGAAGQAGIEVPAGDTLTLADSTGHGGGRVIATGGDGAVAIGDGDGTTSGTVTVAAKRITDDDLTQLQRGIPGASDDATSPMSYAAAYASAGSRLTLRFGHRLSFSTGAGSAVPDQLTVPGVTSATPADPTRTNATFAGWYANDTHTIPFDFAATRSTDVIAYAKWDAPIAPTILTTLLPDAHRWTTYSARVIATGTPAPTFSVVAPSALPDGLTLDPVTGVISGAPTTDATATFTVRASNLGGDVDRAFTIAVGAPVTTVTLSTTTAKAGTELTITGAGFQPGETVQAVMDGSTLTTATAGSDGIASATVTLPFTIADGSRRITLTGLTSGQSATSDWVTIDHVATTRSVTLPDAVMGVGYHESLAGSAPGATYVIQWGALPTGLSLDESTGAITGDAVYDIASSRRFDACAVTGTTAADVVCTAYTLTAVTMSVASTIAAAGDLLPIAGMGFDANETVDASFDAAPLATATAGTTGQVNGFGASVPSDATGGPHTLTLTGASSGKSVSLTITADRRVAFTTPAALPDAQAWAPYTATILATGSPAPTLALAATSQLPGGLTFDAATGEITGTVDGPVSFIVEASNRSGMRSQQFTITAVKPTPTVALGSSTIAAGTTFSVTGTGYKPGEDVDVLLGDGVSTSYLVIDTVAADGDGDLDATVTMPADTATGTYVIALRGSDSRQHAGSAPVTVAQLPAITTLDLPDATRWTAYAATIAATGSPAPTLSVVDGSLPAWLSLDGATGALSGTPPTAGSVSFTIRATSAAGHVDRTYTLTVADVTATIALGVTSLTAGDTLPLSGTGFQPGEEVSVLLDSTPLSTATITAGSLGDIAATVTIPVGTSAGSHTLTLVGADSGQRATSGTLTVTAASVDPAPATVQVGAGRVVAGHDLAVTAHGFTPGEGVAIVLHSTPVRLATVTADADGAIATVVRIPAGTPAGQHTLVLTGLASGRTAVSAVITVSAAPAGPATKPSLSGVRRPVARHGGRVFVFSAAGVRTSAGVTITGYTWRSGGKVLGHHKRLVFHPARARHAYRVTLTVRASNGTRAARTFTVVWRPRSR